MDAALANDFGTLARFLARAVVAAAAAAATPATTCDSTLAAAALAGSCHNIWTGNRLPPAPAAATFSL